MQRDKKTEIAVFAVLALVAVAVRLACPMPNFHPVTAASLFAGFYFTNRTLAIMLPLVIMNASDYFLGGYSMSVMMAVYGSLMVPIAWRSVLRRRLTPGRIVVGSLLSSLVFFLVTNFAVWCAWYPQTWVGFARCYNVAIPFFANAIAGDLLFAGTFFTLYAVGQSLAASWQRKPLLCEAAG